MFHIKRTVTIAGVALLLANNSAIVSGISQETDLPAGNAAQSGCSTIYNGNNGWLVDMCATDPAVAVPMEILVDGVSQGDAALVRIYHQSQSGPGVPQVVVIYASGYVRLKQNADPTPSIPFGPSFVLGPSYWHDSSTYYHNPQIERLEVDTSWLPNAPLRMQMQGTNHDFDVTYEMTLPPPRDRQTRLHVTQTYTATANINIDPTRRAEHQGFKLVQASSMYINEGGACDGGYTDCHDSNAARFIGDDLARHEAAFASLTLPALVFASPVPLGSTWLDVLHTEDQGWQSQTGVNTSGNTPNVRIALDDLPTSHTITPQGWIGSTTDPNDDNVSLWLHDDGSASVSWLTGQSGQVGYWLLAQDDPPEPWTDLDLRSDLTFLDFEGGYDCFLVKEIGQPTSGSVATIGGYTDTALQLDYDLGADNGNWVQIRCDFDPPLDLSAYDHLRFDWRGDSSAANSLEIGLINPTGGGENIFARGYHHPTQHGWWGQMVIPFSFLHPWTDGASLDPSRISAFFISVVKDPVDDTGGPGRIAIDNLNAYNVASRITPGTFETVDTNPTAAQAAAGWLVSQQQPTGLIKSWEEEASCVSHTYDQALALIVFADQGMWAEADALVGGLAATQNSDGSWYKSRNCDTLASVDATKWEGDIAWAVYALSRYIDLGGAHPQASTVLQKGADWLGTRVDPADGCLAIDHTEGTIDAWWAFQSAGTSHTGNAEKIENCLLTYYWDDTIGRFKGGRDWQHPYMDNQTWGAAFLKAIGETEKARRALSYARDVFPLPAQGGQLFGYDGQAGPWSVWNEGTAQYIAVGGDGANDVLQDVLAQQEANGAMVGSPDEFSGGGVWTTRWHGVAPTAWLYFALCGEPFHPGGQAVCTLDTIAPSVSNSIRADSNPTNETSITFTVTFSETVTGVNTTAPYDDLKLTTTGVTGASITGVSGSGGTYTVTVNTGFGNGTIRLDVVDNDSIKDAANNPLGGIGAGNGNFIAGEVYDVQKDITPPGISYIVRAGLNPTNASVVNFTVTFSEPVGFVDTNDFTLTRTGTINNAKVDGVSGSGGTYTVTVSTGTGSGTIRLDVPNTATITDMLGNGLAGLPYTGGEAYSVRTTTFTDVSNTYWAWQYIERLYNAGITGGCTISPLNYCPESEVTRAQMAVFLEKGLHYPATFTAPNVAPTFSDTVGHWAEDWIEALKSDGVTAGCATGLYCPENPVTRAQMAVFLLKAKYGSSYAPPNVGTSTGFGDVPTDHWASAWIKQLAAESITGGCGGGNYCPESPVTRAQMAVFLVKTFNLP